MACHQRQRLSFAYGSNTFCQSELYLAKELWPARNARDELHVLASVVRVGAGGWVVEGRADGLKEVC